MRPSHAAVSRHVNTQVSRTSHFTLLSVYKLMSKTPRHAFYCVLGSAPWTRINEQPPQMPCWLCQPHPEAEVTAPSLTPRRIPITRETGMLHKSFSLLSCWRAVTFPSDTEPKCRWCSALLRVSPYAVAHQHTQWTYSWLPPWAPNLRMLKSLMQNGTEFAYILCISA